MQCGDAMKTIYMVTSGEYSDYHVCGLFTTRELAEHYVKLHTEGREYHSSYDIDEVVLDEISLDMVSKEVKGVATLALRDERTSRFALKVGQVESRDGYEEFEIVSPEKDTVIRQWASPAYEGFTVISFISKEHAHKVAVEEYQKRRALAVLGGA